MSSSINAGIIPVAGCAGLPATFQPGAVYQVTGLVQGTLGAYSVLVKALDPNSLDTSVSVFPAGELTGDGWTGVFDWAACQLIRVQDLLGNDVSDAANISLFQWFDTDVHSNTIERGAVIGAWPPSVGVFQGNRFGSGTSLIWSLSAGLINFERNLVTGIVIINLEIDGAFTLENSEVHGSGGIIATGGALGTFVLQEVIINNALIEFGAAGQLRFNDCLINGSNVNYSSGDAGVQFNQSVILGCTIFIPVWTGSAFAIFTRTSFQNGSVITGAAVFNDQVDVADTLFNASTLNLAGTRSQGQRVERVLATGGSTLILGANATGFSLISGITLVGGTLNITEDSDGANVYVEYGTLITAGFDLTDVRLQDADSTLIANVVDATKSGYVNALP